MKRFLVPAAFLLLGIAAMPLHAETPARFDANREMREKAAGKLHEAMEIRKQMRTIEQQTIQADPELKKQSEDIQEKFRAFHQQLEMQLVTNPEYQTLKAKMEKMRGDFAQGGEKWLMQKNSRRKK